MRLSGNTILITGASSGIGEALAKYLAEQGNTILAVGRRKERLEALSLQNPKILPLVADISKALGRNQLLDYCHSKAIQVDWLINNAGIQLATNLTKPVEGPLVYEEIDTNLIAPIHLSSLFVDHLRNSSNPAIINISSGLAFAPLAFMPIYCATKAAIHSFTLSLRFQLRQTSIKVFEIIPPSVDTELGHQRRVDKTQSHGGIPVDDFLREAIEGLKNDVLETAVGQSKGLRAKREELFEEMNLRVPH